LTIKQVDLLTQFIKNNWDYSSAWPDFVEAMLHLLPGEIGESDHHTDSDRWALLPGLCCQASGGDPVLTTEVSAAWLLLYVAAHLVDSVEDGDLNEEIMTVGGSGSAINIANGYFLSAVLILNDLAAKDRFKRNAQQICADFLNTILVMTSGQHLDINLPRLSLEQWWQVAEAKTGSFFSLACRSGAQFGTDDSLKIEAFSDYGFHLGLMLQIHDDIEDLKLLMAEEISEIPASINRSLAFTYAVEVLPDREKSRLQELIERKSHESASVDEVIGLLNQSGAGLYLLAEMKRHYELAVKSLEKAAPSSSAGEKLLAFIRELKLK
jgi:geranylgeranyl pyrophosphate synthase